MCSDSGSVKLQLCEVLGGIGSVELTGVDQGHEEIAHGGAVQRLVEQCIPAIQNRFFQCPFDDIVVDWRARLLEEQRQLPPVVCR